MPRAVANKDETDRQTDGRTDTSPMHVGFPRDTASVNSVTCLSWPQRVEQSTKGTRGAELGNALGRHERTRRRIIVALYQQVPLSALIPPPCLSSPPLSLSASMFVCLSISVGAPAYILAVLDGHDIPSDVFQSRCHGDARELLAPSSSTYF